MQRRNIFLAFKFLMLVSLLAACAPSEPTPSPACYVDWNWGGATLEVIGPDADEYCYGFVAYGYQDYELMFYSDGSVGGETIVCEFEGEAHRFRVWDEPSFGAGTEFCEFIASFSSLP